MSLSIIRSNIIRNVYSLVQPFTSNYRVVEPGLQLAIDGFQRSTTTTTSHNNFVNNPLEDMNIWFAVPKSRISKSRKRMKHQLSKIVNKTHIQPCPVTGEVTLRHKLPPNWKKYLSEIGFTGVMNDKK